MNKRTGTWTSPARHLDNDPDMCIDVRADSKGIVVGYVGKSNLGSIGLSIADGAWLAKQLIAAQKQNPASGGTA